MPTENDQIVAGMVIGIITLLIAASFIFILVTYSNKRKNKFIQEKQNLQLLFNEQMLRSQLEMQEQTFNTISQEIHDNVGQILSLAKVQINIMEQGQTLNRPLLKDVKDSVSKALTDLRDIAKSLNTERIRLSSLIEMTNHELQRLNRLGTIQTNLVAEGIEEYIDDQKKVIVFRILQESIQNILKHANANRIHIKYEFNKSHFILNISDDGKGFDRALVSKKDGLGLQNITSRAILIGGQAFIQSKAGEGTNIKIILPYG